MLPELHSQIQLNLTGGQAIPLCYTIWFNSAMKDKCTPLQCNTVAFPVTQVINIPDVLELFLQKTSDKPILMAGDALWFCAGEVRSSFKEEETKEQFPTNKYLAGLESKPVPLNSRGAFRLPNGTALSFH